MSLSFAGLNLIVLKPVNQRWFILLRKSWDDVNVEDLLEQILELNCYDGAERYFVYYDFFICTMQNN